MKICVLRKVPYRLPGTTRLVWGVILCEREGLSLLFVQRSDDNHSHSLVVAMEDVANRFYEPANGNIFPLDHEDLVDIGNKLRALGKGFSETEFEKLFRLDGL